MSILIKNTKSKIIITAIISSSLMSITGCSLQNKIPDNKNNNKYNNKSASTTAYLALAKQQLYNNNLKIAHKNLLKAESISPKSALVQASLGLYSLKVKEFNQAKLYYQKAINLEPKNPEIQNQYAAYLCGLNKDDKSNQENQENQAIKYFDKAIKNKKYTEIATAYQNKGLCLYKNFNDLYSSKDNSIKLKKINKIKNNIYKTLNKALSHDPKLALSYLTLSELEFKLANINKNKNKHLKLSYNYLKEFDKLEPENDRSKQLHQKLDNK